MKDVHRGSHGGWWRRFVLGVTTVLILAACRTPVLAAELTHGPMVGHTTENSTRIWVRSNRACDFHVRLTGQENREVLSETVRLQEMDNFCGSVRVSGLAPGTAYDYRVILDGKEQSSDLVQSVRTFPSPGKPGVFHIGIGHSLRGKAGDPQTIWLPIADQKRSVYSDGGQYLLQQHRAGKAASHVSGIPGGPPF